MAPRKFMVAPCIFDSCYSWFVYICVILKLPAEYDYIIHLLISSSETHSAFVCIHVMTYMIGGLFVSSYGLHANCNVHWWKYRLTFNTIKSIASQFLQSRTLYFVLCVQLTLFR